MAEPIKVGVVGCGAIGSEICRAIDRGDVPGVALVAVCDPAVEQREKLLGELQQPPQVLDLADLAQASELVVEAVSKSVASQVIEAALAGNADVLTMSVAGLVDHDELIQQAAAAGRRIYIPTGAIAGLDAVRAAKVAGIDEAMLITTKPPRGLTGAPWVVSNQLDLDSYTEVTTIFEGSAREAVAAFPKNVNVSAALSLAGIGVDRTRVRVVVDPTADTNRHQVVVSGAFGRLEIAVDNVPSPTNPKTSYLAALSAIALLQRLGASLVVGS